MAFFDTTWYVNFGNGSSTGYYAVTVRPQNTAVAAGVLRRQFTAPAVGSERVFVCIVAGTTANTTDATWVTTRGAKTTDGTATWQECTGASAVNGDLTNTPNWTTVKSLAVTLGQIIKRNNGASYQICSTAGTAGSGSEPAFSDTAGTTTADNTITWTSLGVIGNFTGGGAPFARLASALTATWVAVGNAVYVSSAHAETQSTAMTLTSVGTLANPVTTECVSFANFPPLTGDITTGASIATTGASGFTLTGACWIVDGITFKVGSGSSAAFMVMGGGPSAIFHWYRNCSFQMGTTGTVTSGLAPGDATNTSFSKCVYDNCKMKFLSTGQSFNPRFDQIIWRNTGTLLESGSSIPSNFIVCLNTQGNIVDITFDSVDLSQLTGTILPEVTLSAGTQDMGGRLLLKDCKLNASVTIVGTMQNPGMWVDVVRCDSGAHNYRNERYDYYGSEITETTIVRTGGANDGVTSLARKIVTLGNTRWPVPFEAMPIVVWNDITGSSIDIDLYGIWGGGAVPNNDDIWMDVEYLGSSGSPLGSYASGTKANRLATGSAHNSDSSTWGGSTTAFRMRVSVTPNMKGPITLLPKAARASTTFYLDPRPVLSVGGGISKSYTLAPGVHTNELRTPSPSLHIGI